MSQSKKRKKKVYPGTPSAAPRDPALLQDGRGDKRMSPLARRLLFFDIVLVALAQILDRTHVISTGFADILTIIACLLLAAVILIQWQYDRSGRSDRPGSGGPRL